jgi:hypothetical protein
MILTGTGDIAGLVHETIGPWLVSDAPGRAEVLDASDLTDEQRAALYDLADAQLWTVNPPRGAATALWARLTPQQQALGLGSLFRGSRSGLVSAVALAGVEVVSVMRQGVRVRTYVLARADVGTTALGEAAPAAGAVPLVEVQYRYRLAASGLVAGEARVLYPTGEGTYLVAPEDVAVDAWEYPGQSAIDDGIARRRSAASRAGYLLGVGARVHGGFEDPGVPIRTLLAVLSGSHGYDLVAAYREYDDPTLRTAIAEVEGVPWLDGPLPGGSARDQAVAEVDELETGPDGWTSWP